MDLTPYLARNGEQPLETIVSDGGFFKIFRTVGCIGDSLSSGEFQSLSEESLCPGFHDFYEYSWGQYMAREAGVTVYNFSRGGMTAAEYIDRFADQNGFWDEDKLCQCYIIALGVNDIFNQKKELGSVSDIDLSNFYQNKRTFAGDYARIIQKLKTMQPKAKFFLMTMPKSDNQEENVLSQKHAELLYGMADMFKYTYVLDFYKYAPVYDSEFKRNFYLGGHLNPAGYVLTAKMVMSYIDFIIRNNPEDFAQVCFIEKPYHNCKAKW